MAKYLRRIDSDSKKFWESLDVDNWLVTDDVPPEILGGWLDQNLSIWKIGGSTEDEQKKEAEEIMFGLYTSIKKDKPEKLAYVVFDESAANPTDCLTPEHSNGKTGFQKLDTSNRHFEIKNLSGKRLCKLILNILKSHKKDCVSIFKLSEFNKRIDDMLNSSKNIGITRLSPNITSENEETSSMRSSTTTYGDTLVVRDNIVVTRSEATTS